MTKPKKSTMLFIFLFGAMFLFGLVENVRGVTYPLIKAEFSVSYEQQGMMVSLMSFSYVVFCMVGGILLGNLGVKKAFMAGFVFIMLGLLAVFFMPGFWSIAAAMVVIFAGFGLFEVSSNALAAQLFTTRTALLMSLLHFFFGAGSALSPMAAGVLSAALSWRHVYLLAIPVVLVFFIPSLFTRFPQTDAPPDTSADAPADGEHEKAPVKKLSFFTALKNPMVWIFAVTLGCMMTVEMSTPNWAGLYFQDVYHLDPKTVGAAFVSNFFILFTISRLVSGFVIEKIGYLRSIYIATFIVIFIYILGFFLGAKGIYILPVLGFFVSIYWPTILATAMGYFKKDAPVMTSAIIVIAGAINGGNQFFIGLTNRLIGPAWGYRGCLVYTVIIIALLMVLGKRIRNTFKGQV